MNRDDSEAGFTLVEVMVATVISAIVIGGIAAILIVTLESYPRSAARLTLSDNAQLLSSWLVPDVQSASGSDQGITTGPLTDIPGCAVPASSNVVTLTWSDYDIAGVVYVAAYRQVGSELMRYYCKGGVLVSTTIVSRDLAPAPNGATATRSVDSVTIAMQTLDQLTRTPGYNFSVSASRLTPALRIFPVQQLDSAFISGQDPITAITGTALKGAQVTLTVTDQSGGSTNRTFYADATTGNWSVPVTNVDWSDLNLVGLVTFDVTSTNASLKSTATTSTMTPLIPVVSKVSPDPTNSSPVEFLVTFNEPIVNLDGSDFQASGPKGESLVAVPDVPRASTCAAGTAPGSVCALVKVYGVDTVDDGDDGPVTLSLPANQVFDKLGNPNVASSSVHITWDLNLPIVTPNNPNPTSTAVSFLVRFPYGLQAALTSTEVSVSSTTIETSMATTVTSGSCPLPSQCFTISVTGLSTGTDTTLTAQVNPNVVRDRKYGGFNSQSRPSPALSWSTSLTIAETAGPGPTMSSFSGVAALGTPTVTVTFCADEPCTTFLPPSTVPVVAGNWTTSVPNTEIAGYQYAEVTQGSQNVFTKIT